MLFVLFAISECVILLFYYFALHAVDFAVTNHMCVDSS